MLSVLPHETKALATDTHVVEMARARSFAARPGIFMLNHKLFPARPVACNIT